MAGRLKFVLTLVTAGAVLAPVATVQAQQQVQGRFRVLIPDFEAQQDADRNFGEDAAEELRELVNSLATHEPIEEDEIKDALKQFKMKMEELDCIRTRQLASQIDAQVALCASYVEEGEERVVQATFWDVAASEPFDIETQTVHKDNEEAAAQHIFDQFDQYVQQIRFAQFCGDYARSQQWENALRNCDSALDLNPEATSTRYQKASILRQADRPEEALAELEVILEDNPFHEDALQLAGYVAATLGQDDAAREYYSKYLELDPMNARVRMKIAYDLAQAGDPRGAMELIQAGLDADQENIDLWEQYGSFAFNAGLEAEKMAAVGTPAGEEDAGGIAPEAVELYRNAIEAYTRVFEAKGEETPVRHLRQIISAYVKLGELSQAIGMAQRALETHAQEDALWSIYADALQRDGQLDEAIAALDRVREINPSYPNISLRQGNWLIQAGRIEDAVAILKEAAAGNPEQAEQAARLIFADSYQNGYQNDRFQYAITGLSAAKELPGLSQSMIHQLNFWHGFSLYQQAVDQQEPQTLETAQATLPRFQRAMELFRQVGDYPSSVNVNLNQLMDNANTFIEIQEAIIKRGR